ncbi:hypothetical protein [Kutzneria kofuensis]|uniref:hypothetical protein n=1 Tax=Kutzneria kofuensis TaxID=103725 RepID=UPI0031E76DE2
MHHANQLVITDGYEDRDGITRICEGYTAALELHAELGIPAALHLSGTLVEAVAWHHPEFLAKVRELVAAGVLTLLGGTYSEPIMPLGSAAINRRQVRTMAELLERHLDVPGGALPTAWLPERVWHPDLHEVLTDPTLPGGGFKRVLVDDRLLSPAVPQDGYPADCRGGVDLRGPYTWDPQRPPAFTPGLADPRLFVPRTVEQPRPLSFVPISAHLRYLMPPPTSAHLHLLDALLDDLATRSDDPDSMIAVYADDLERTVGVAGWQPALDRYAELLRWVAGNGGVRPVSLDAWLDEHTPQPGPVVEAGAYYELEVQWRAGTDYRGWSDQPSWRPYAELLAAVEDEVDAARAPEVAEQYDQRLVDLADRLLMVGNHETAWHDREHGNPTGVLAPWVRAVASHTKLARPLLAAARWSAGPAYSPAAGLWDIDGDGAEELMLVSNDIWAVVSPQHGARVSMLVHRRPGDVVTQRSSTPAGSALIVGNPLDHWNFQEELHRFMDTPPGHPGAITDSQRPHLPWVPSVAVHRPDAVAVDLYPRDTDPSAEVRRYSLIDGVPGLVVCVQLPAYGDSTIENALIPDYLGSLVSGRDGITEIGGDAWRGWNWQGHQCWLGFDPSQASITTPRWQAAGHCLSLAVKPHDRHVDFIIGAGPVHDSFVHRWLAVARDVLHLTPEFAHAGHR